MERGVVNAVVTIGGRLVSPGDLIIGDDDGLAALSPAAIRSYIGDAEAKLALEEVWQKSLADGRSVAETFGLPPYMSAN
jgi:regulator of RNase E activity RraA